MIAFAWAIALAADAPFVVRSAPLSDADRAAMTPSAWRPGCPVGLDELVKMEIGHWLPDGSTAVGILVVHRDMAVATETAFRALWDQRFPIASMRPIETFAGNDDASMVANNTSAFNCRPKTGVPGSWSTHASGRAIDVNPLWNPFVRPGHPPRVSPAAGGPFADRTQPQPGMMRPDEPAVRAFKDAGWRWGGDWRSAKDWQHFSADGT